MNNKEQISFYISGEIRKLVTFLRKREEITKIVFYKRALRLFFEGEQKIDPRILITERSHPDYIRREVLETVQIEPEQKQAVKKLAEERGCKEGHIMFMAVLEYCGMLLSIDSTGVKFK
jgi:hypothetical protein